MVYTQRFYLALAAPRSPDALQIIESPLHDLYDRFPPLDRHFTHHSVYYCDTVSNRSE